MTQQSKAILGALKAPWRIRKKMADRLLSFREAERYGPKEKTWRNWYYAGLIPVIRLGRRVYLSEDAIRKMVEEGTIPARRPTR